MGATAVAVVTQTRNHYFEDPEEASDAATQAALEAGSDTAGVAYAPEEMSDYPPQEALDVEDVMSRMDQILAYEEGGPEDGWTLMFSGEDELTRDTYYVADSLSAWSSSGPRGPPTWGGWTPTLPRSRGPALCRAGGNQRRGGHLHLHL